MRPQRSVGNILRAGVEHSVVARHRVRLARSLGRAPRVLAARGAPQRPAPLRALRQRPRSSRAGGRRGGSDKGGKEDFEDLRLTLQETDFGSFLAQEPSLDPKIIGLRATGKWVREMQYFRASATGPMARFLDFVSAEYMIDNILDLIKAATSSQRVDMEAVVDNCHPLGMLECVPPRGARVGCGWRSCRGRRVGGPCCSHAPYPSPPPPWSWS